MSVFANPPSLLAIVTYLGVVLGLIYAERPRTEVIVIPVGAAALVGYVMQHATAPYMPTVSKVVLGVAATIFVFTLLGITFYVTEPKAGLRTDDVEGEGPSRE